MTLPVSHPLSASRAIIRLDRRDPLAIARQALAAGVVITADDPGLPFETLVVRQLVPAGHKLALQPIAAGQEVLRYGSRIGVAIQEIEPGEWIHTHNLSVGDLGRDFTLQRVERRPVERDAAAPVFMGYRRPDGRVGTRNLVAVISTVSCSAQVAQAIAHAIPPAMLAAYPNVDGVVAVTHYLGCCSPLDSLTHRYLQRALLNLASHPNIGAAIYVSLGCEGNQMAGLVEPLQALAAKGGAHPLVGPYLVIQEQGGIAKTTAAGVAAIQDLLPRVNAAARTPVPLSGLTVALQCGGSDGWSGVTANPLVGQVSDRIVRAGGAVVLAETPEIYGAEQLLLCRAASEAVGQKLIERLRWWQAQAQAEGFSLDNNPSPGNKAGGLTTIYEKSLGAVAKGGSTPLRQVLEYAETVTSSGLVFMDTPGYDPVAITGQVAGGCNLVVFTTGRGSVFGGSLAPCIKVASHSALYRQMQDDMDFNAGIVLEGQTLEASAPALLDLVVRVASGAPTCSERSGYRQAEFIPWHLGGML